MNIQEFVFLWLIQILKAVTMIMVTAIAFFWSSMRNPAIGAICPIANENAIAVRHSQFFIGVFVGTVVFQFSW